MPKLNATLQWIAVSALVLHSVGCKTPHPDSAPPPQSSSSEGFFSTPNTASWHRLVEDENVGANESFAMIAKHIAVYNEARLQRDLPNSLSRDGKVDEHLQRQAEIMKREFAVLGRLSYPDVSKLLTLLCDQQFDDDLIWTAAEIEFRFSSARLSEIAQNARPRNREVIASVQERFAAGHGHIGEW